MTIYIGREEVMFSVVVIVAAMIVVAVAAPDLQ
jgi:hypothetical protein